MRELQVLSNGHLKLDFAEWKDFFEQELAEQVRAQLKALMEKAMEGERDRYLDLGYYEQREGAGETAPSISFSSGRFRSGRAGSNAKEMERLSWRMQTRSSRILKS